MGGRDGVNAPIWEGGWCSESWQRCGVQRQCCTPVGPIHPPPAQVGRLSKSFMVAEHALSRCSAGVLLDEAGVPIHYAAAVDLVIVSPRFDGALCAVVLGSSM